LASGGPFDERALCGSLALPVWRVWRARGVESDALIAARCHGSNRAHQDEALDAGIDGLVDEPSSSPCVDSSKSRFFARPSLDDVSARGEMNDSIGPLQRFTPVGVLVDLSDHDGASRALRLGLRQATVRFRVAQPERQRMSSRFEHRNQLPANETRCAADQNPHAKTTPSSR
jgi:hypothetical protein